MQTKVGEITHNQTGTSLHMCWKNMKQRCYNPKSERYRHYGEKGITVCPEWQQFEGFMEWAISSGYQDGLTIDRIDTNMGYSPSNCRWVTYEENHKLMMCENLANGTGIFSEESRLRSKEGIRSKYGKPVFLHDGENEFLFLSRGELIEYLAGRLNRNKPSVKTQVNLCLVGKCKTIGGFKVYE